MYIVPAGAVVGRSPTSATVPAIAIDVPAGPSGPVAPVSPLGTTKSNTAADELPLFVTAAFDPAAPVLVVPAAIVAAAPSLPAFPCDPVAPFGIPKSKIAAAVVPTLLTVASAPGESVDVVPTVAVAAAPAAPSTPALP